MDTTPKQEFRIRDLSTRSVTLFPTRAQVVRDIKNVVLKPGANEITILGLSPSVDEDSIKVEGTGSAIITDITVELLPNRDIFEEIYPDSDHDSSDDESDGDESNDDKKDSEAMASLIEKLDSLEDEQKRAKEILASAESQVKILDSYGESINRENTDSIRDDVKQYREERKQVFNNHMDAVVQDRQLSKAIADLKLEKARLAKVEEKQKLKANKAKAKAYKAQQKEAEKKARRKLEAWKEKNRIRKEREDLWPVFCWSVRITLDAVNLDTPGSSRRSSIASASDLVKIPTESSDSASYTCDLSLSYVVSSAYWSPSYDLSLSTTSNTGILCFDAQLTNKTSENWTNCKITLSTSQATFAGLQDDIPTLVPWRVRLSGRGGGSRSTIQILDSREERTAKQGWQTQQSSWNLEKSRTSLYGYQTAPAQERMRAMQQSAGRSAELQWAQQKQARGGHVIGPGSGLFASATPYASAGNGQPSSMGGLFGAGPSQPAPSGGGLFGSTAQQGSVSAPAIQNPTIQHTSEALTSNNNNGLLKRLSSTGGRKTSPPAHRSGAAQDEAYYDDNDNDGSTVHDSIPTPSLDFQSSSIEETGLTTTYDLPGSKSLLTSSTASKQRVAHITFTSVVFSHVVVPKYKPVAYLKAKLGNKSKLTLLKGPVGLTLDGSFMGRSTLPRCSAGDTFTLSLGVDPAVDVVYGKPEVRRSSSGIFTKEDSSVYTRVTTISNTRHAATATGSAGGKVRTGVHLLVQDQVPVSEDERLKVAVTYPRGMTVGGNAVATGLPGKTGDGKEDDGKDWGRAKASLKKVGEVEWDVELGAGKSVKLVLEYEVAAPGGEGVVQV